MSSADVGFLHRESRNAAQHVAGIIVLATPAGRLDYERMVRLLEERISLAPRFRQKVRAVPLHLANPVWVDDPRFDITYHARRSALPRPGTDAQLLEFGARILSRPLDRSRPLWEMYLVEGLDGDRTAIITKTHAAMIGEPGGIDLAQVILDAGPEPRRTVEAIWMPSPEPSSLELVRDAVSGVLRRPMGLGETARSAARDVQAMAERVTSLAGGTAPTVRALVRREPASPLQVELGEARRLAIARTRLADYRRVRHAFGVSVNDVVLAVVAGALRGWLLSRSVSMRAGTTVRALAPVSVADPDPDPDAGVEADVDEAQGRRTGRSRHPAGAAVYGRRAPGRPTATGTVAPLLVDLPVGEPDCVVRLTQVRYAMATHRASGRAVDAHKLTELAGFAPPTLHALGARAAAELTRRLFSLVITNVPGPQVPLFAAGARMSEMFPISPLSPGHALSVALASYDGGVYYGVNGDRDAVGDIDQFAVLLEESLAELVSASETGAVAAVGRRQAGGHDQPGGALGPGDDR